MSKTTEEWMGVGKDPHTEPYPVVRVSKNYDWADYYNVYYRTYTKAVFRTVRAQDELGAFVVALTELADCKKASDRAYAKKEQTK